MKKVTKKSIWVTWEGFMYLNTKQHEQRSETKKPIGEYGIRKLKGYFDDHANKDGMRQIASGHFGGCIGNPVNAYEEGRWTSWTVDDMKRMLDEAGLPWAEGEEIEYFNI